MSSGQRCEQVQRSAPSYILSAWSVEEPRGRGRRLLVAVSVVMGQSSRVLENELLNNETMRQWAATSTYTGCEGEHESEHHPLRVHVTAAPSLRPPSPTSAIPTPSSSMLSRMRLGRHKLDVTAPQARLLKGRIPLSVAGMLARLVPQPQRLSAPRSACATPRSSVSSHLSSITPINAHSRARFHASLARMLSHSCSLRSQPRTTAHRSPRPAQSRQTPLLARRASWCQSRRPRAHSRTWMPGRPGWPPGAHACAQPRPPSPPQCWRRSPRSRSAPGSRRQQLHVLSEVSEC